MAQVFREEFGAKFSDGGCIVKAMAQNKPFLTELAAERLSHVGNLAHRHRGTRRQKGLLGTFHLYANSLSVLGNRPFFYPIPVVMLVVGLISTIGRPAASRAELPHWVENPQQAADEDEIAVLGTAESPKGIDDAKQKAQDDAIRKAIGAVMELWASALPQIKSEYKGDGFWDDSTLQKAVEECALKHFRTVPYEKWHGTMSATTEGDQMARAYVFLQFPRIDIARLVIDCASGSIRPDKVPLSEHKQKIRRAVGTVTTSLPP